MFHIKNKHAQLLFIKFWSSKLLYSVCLFLLLLIFLKHICSKLIITSIKSCFHLCLKQFPCCNPFTYLLEFEVMVVKLFCSCHFTFRVFIKHLFTKARYILSFKFKENTVYKSIIVADKKELVCIHPSTFISIRKIHLVKNT